MGALLAYVRPHRGTLVLAALLGAAAGLAQPLAAREVIEALGADESLRGADPDPQRARGGRGVRDRARSRSAT